MTQAQHGDGPVPEESVAGRPSGVDRRTAVRRAATALGLTAGALALPALAGTADAKPGDTVKAGGSTAAGGAQTNLRASTTIAAVQIQNAQVRPTLKNAVDVVSPQLRLSAPVPSGDRPQVPEAGTLRAGDLAAAGGLLFYGADLGAAEAVPVQVHTAGFGNYFQPVAADAGAVVDTTTLSAEGRAAFPPDAFDPQGRLAPNVRVLFDLRPWVDTSHLPTGAAVSISVSTSASDASGVLSAHLGQATPGLVPIARFTVLPAEVTRSGQPFALPVTAGAVVALDSADKLWLSTTAATHVAVQIVGLFISDPSARVENPEVPADLAPPARRSALQRQAVREMTAGITPTK